MDKLGNNSTIYAVTKFLARQVLQTGVYLKYLQNNLLNKLEKYR